MQQLIMSAFASQSKIFSDELRDKYKYLSVPCVDLDDAKEHKVSEAYINLVQIKEEEFGSQSNILECNDVFPNREDGNNRVLLEAPSASGKTTFMRYVASSWALKSWGEQFDYVLYIRLSEIKSTRWNSRYKEFLGDSFNTDALKPYFFIHWCCALDQEIFDILNGSITKETLCKKVKFISELNKEKVLLLVDDYNEVVDQMHHGLGLELMNIIIGYPNVVLASKPGIVVGDLRKNFPDDNRINNIGFDDAGVIEFSEKYSSGDVDQKQKIKFMIAANPEIKRLYKMPVYTALINKICSKKYDHFLKGDHSLFELVRNMIDQMGTRFFSKKNSTDITGLDFDHILMDLMRDIAHTLVTENQDIFPGNSMRKLVLSDKNRAVIGSSGMDDQRTSIYRHMDDFGILRAYNHEGTQFDPMNFRFIHDLFKQWLCADYIYRDLLREPDMTVSRIMKHCESDMFMVMKFLSGFVAHDNNARNSVDNFWKAVTLNHDDKFKIVGKQTIGEWMRWLSQCAGKSFPDSEHYNKVVEYIDNKIIAQGVSCWKSIIIETRYIGPRVLQSLLDQIGSWCTDEEYNFFQMGEDNDEVAAEVIEILSSVILHDERHRHQFSVFLFWCSQFGSEKITILAIRAMYLMVGNVAFSTEDITSINDKLTMQSKQILCIDQQLPKVISLMEYYIKNNNVQIFMVACENLGKIGGAAVIRMLTNQLPLVLGVRKLAIISALGDIGYESTTYRGVVIKTLTDSLSTLNYSQQNITEEILHVLNRLQKSKEDLIQECINNLSPDYASTREQRGIRDRAVLILGNIAQGSSDVVQRLLSFLDEKRGLFFLEDEFRNKCSRLKVFRSLVRCSLTINDRLDTVSKLKIEILKEYAVDVHYCIELIKLLRLIQVKEASVKSQNNDVWEMLSRLNHAEMNEAMGDNKLVSILVEQDSGSNYLWLKREYYVRESWLGENQSFKESSFIENDESIIQKVNKLSRHQSDESLMQEIDSVSNIEEEIKNEFNHIAYDQAVKILVDIERRFLMNISDSEFNVYKKIVKQLINNDLVILIDLLCLAKNSVSDYFRVCVIEIVNRGNYSNRLDAALSVQMDSPSLCGDIRRILHNYDSFIRDASNQSMVENTDAVHNEPLYLSSREQVSRQVDDGSDIVMVKTYKIPSVSEMPESLCFAGQVNILINGELNFTGDLFAVFDRFSGLLTNRVQDWFSHTAVTGLFGEQLRPGHWKISLVRKNDRYNFLLFEAFILGYLLVEYVTESTRQIYYVLSDMNSSTCDDILLFNSARDGNSEYKYSMSDITTEEKNRILDSWYESYERNSTHDVFACACCEFLDPMRKNSAVFSYDDIQRRWSRPDEFVTRRELRTKMELQNQMYQSLLARIEHLTQQSTVWLNERSAMRDQLMNLETRIVTVLASELNIQEIIREFDSRSDEIKAVLKMHRNDQATSEQLKSHADLLEELKSESVMQSQAIQLITDYLDMLRGSRVYRDPYREGLYQALKRQLNAIGLAALVTQTDIVLNSRQGAGGLMAKMFNFASTVLPVLGIGGKLLELYNVHSQCEMVKKYAGLVGDAVNIAELSDQIARVLLGVDDDIGSMQLDIDLLKEKSLHCIDLAEINYKAGLMLGACGSNVINAGSLLAKCITGTSPSVHQQTSEHDDSESHAQLIAIIISSYVYSGFSSDLVNAHVSEIDIKADLMANFALRHVSKIKKIMNDVVANSVEYVLKNLSGQRVSTVARHMDRQNRFVTMLCKMICYKSKYLEIHRLIKDRGLAICDKLGNKLQRILDVESPTLFTQSRGNPFRVSKEFEKVRFHLPSSEQYQFTMQACVDRFIDGALEIDAQPEFSSSHVRPR